MEQLLKRNLTDKISVEILPVDSEKDLHERVWAINWFNYKRKWLYTLYNRLAAKHVIQVGGRLLFKGHRQRTLFGEETLARHTLLIVTYPKVDNFLDMLTIKAFQLKSLLRLNAVKKFVFGFTRRVDTETVEGVGKKSGAYLVCHYQGVVDSDRLHQLAGKHNLQMFFHGKKTGQIKRSEQGKDEVIAPFFMDGIILLVADNSNAYEEFVTDSDFIQLADGNKTNYVAIFDRVK